ncbi:hypothetical protein CXF68_03850 [Tenacibaculum sp. Bg11-29]|uniref:hypothetical protein n=1 Tax=Tenacibaculum sp. Bg11-29 TaxID=2058306 RepID=UPI000C32C18A|nr:hypothetical protein [Tenacibaculum sp. Bg11-29]PKH49886.1 hypothetical protein CXF68_03850 [Tenacibaculum sp. Bg11-29]
MNNFKLTIPKPCNESWDKMTPNEKGKFCKLCAKTVVDFTTKSTSQIKDYLIENKGKRVCGHFYKKQLDSIVIQLPETTFNQSLSFQKIFLLALIFAMGTTLFSCTTNTGKVQKIDKVEIIDSIIIIEDITDIELDGFVIPVLKKDSVKKELKIPPLPSVEGITVIETVLEEPFNIDTIIEVPEMEVIEPEDVIRGGIRDNSDLEYESIKTFFYSREVNYPPIFLQDENLPKENLINVFDKRIKQFLKDNYDSKIHESLSLLKGAKKLYVRISINARGMISKVEVRAPHEKIKTHVKDVLKKLPQLLPATKDGKKVSVMHVFSIVLD